MAIELVCCFPRSSSSAVYERPAGQGISHDAARAKQGIKSTVRGIKQGIKNGAAQAKRKLAVARCNDGQYSYTQYRTCNHHGGVKQQFR